MKNPHVLFWADYLVSAGLVASKITAADLALFLHRKYPGFLFSMSRGMYCMVSCYGSTPSAADVSHDINGTMNGEPFFAPRISCNGHHGNDVPDYVQPLPSSGVDGRGLLLFGQARRWATRAVADFGTDRWSDSPHNIPVRGMYYDTRCLRWVAFDNVGGEAYFEEFADLREALRYATGVEARTLDGTII